MKDRFLCYVKLYFKFTEVNFKVLKEYDLDFLFGIVALIMENLINILIIIFIFDLVDNIKGWDFNQILFLYAFSSTSFGIWHYFFVNTISIPYYIRTGTLDRFLLRPINPVFQIMTDSFDEDGIADLLFGSILLVIASNKLKITVTKILFLPLLIVSGSLIYASLTLLGSLVSFFTITNTDLSDLTMKLSEFSKYPLDIYTHILRLIFTTIIPIGFAAYYPSLFYLTNNKFSKFLLIVSPIISLIFFLLVCKIWNLALRKYSSSGS